MNALRYLAILLAVITVALAATSSALVHRNRQLTAQLAAAESEIRSQRTGPAGAPRAERAPLRMLLEAEQEANAALRDELARLQTATPPSETNDLATSLAEPAAPAGERGGGDRRGAWFERMREEDPERYQRLIEERDRRRRAADQRFQEQLASLDLRVQTAATAREAQVANDVADTLSRLYALRDEYEALRDLPEEERRAQAANLHDQTHALFETLGTLREQDRQVQLENLARSAGYTDQSSIQRFVDTVTGIYQSTDYIMGPGSGRRGRGPGFAGGGPPPSPQP